MYRRFLASIVSRVAGLRQFLASRRVAGGSVVVEGEGLLRLLADSSNDMIVWFTANGVRRYVSPASMAILGFTPEQLVGRAAAGAIHPDDRASVLATCRTLLDGAERPICSYRQLHKDGHYVWLEASYRLVRDPATGQPDGFMASVRDVGHRTRAELERTTSAARLEAANRLLLMAEEMGGIGHWRADVATDLVHWSDTVCAIHGQPPGYTPQIQTAIDAYHPDDRARVQLTVDTALRTGKDYWLKAMIVRPDGAIRHVVSRGRAETGPDGSITGLFGVFQDVTEAHEAEQALLSASAHVTESNRMLTMAEAVAHLGHWRVEDTTGTYFWSDEIYRIYGLDKDFVPTFENTLERCHPDDRRLVQKTVNAAMATGGSYHFRARIVRPDGAIVHVFVRGEVDRAGSGKLIGLFGILQDISEQAEAEERIRASEARFRLITEQASDMISVQDLDGQCIFMSPASQSVLGYDPAAMIGKRPQDFALDEDHPAIDAYSDRVRRSEPGQVSTLRFRIRHADSEFRWMEVASRRADYAGRVGVISVARDVTGQVRNEEALRDARLEAEAAVRAKSSFLANMSHEIRTPMNGVVGFAELLLAGNLSPEQRRQTELIADSSDAMMRLLNDILDLSKIEAGQMTVCKDPVDLVHMLKACMMLIAPAAEQKGLALRCDVGRDVPTFILGDGLRLRQVVLNLLGNAAKFTLEGAITLRVSIDGETGLAIEVKDTGIGIAPEDQRAIFEQFVQADGSTASRFGGTGLGLAISSQLARLMGGDISVASEPGRGTCFTFRLPLDLPRTARGVPGASAGATPAAPVARTRILVAEDHEVNQLLLSAMLEKLGCDADIAKDGSEAVALVAEAVAMKRPYALVLMDMRMPVMNGIEATRRIRAGGIDAALLPIVAVTANAYAEDIAACLDAGMQAHVAKPFSLESIGAVLRRWVTAAPAAEVRNAARFDATIQERYEGRKVEALERLDRLIRRGTFEDAELDDVATMLRKLAGTAEMLGDVTLEAEARLLKTGLATWGRSEIADRIVRSVDAIQRAA